MRLDKIEMKALQNSIRGKKLEIYLFGSRADDNQKGGDIDILVYSKENPLRLSMQISKEFFLECEEKIDVVVVDKDNMTKEQKAFISTLDLRKII